MCDPVAIGITSGVLSLATGAFSYVQQQSAIDEANAAASQQAQAAAMNDLMTSQQQSYWAFENARRAEDSALAAAERDYELLQQQETEINQESATAAFERIRQGLRERASVMVAAAEAGALGQSEQVGEANVLFQTAYDKALIEKSRQDKIAYTEAQKDANAQKLKDRLDDVSNMRLQGKITADSGVTQSMQRLANVKKYSNVNPFAEGLKIVGGAAQAGFSNYATAKSIK